MLPPNLPKAIPVSANVTETVAPGGPDEQTKIRVDSARPKDPTTPGGLKAGDMPPVAAAGVNLATIVLGIVAGAIVILMAYLVWMDWTIATNVGDSYKQALTSNRAGAEFYTLDRLERFASDLSTARSNSTQTLSAAAAQKDQEAIQMLGQLPSLTSAQQAQLKQCVPLPTDSSRNEKLDQCVTIANSVRQAALEAASSSTTAQIAGEATTKIHEQRQSLHTFWIQVAQLILLNLLLPLLTALFGYIFGTQQSQRASG